MTEVKSEAQKQDEAQVEQVRQKSKSEERREAVMQAEKPEAKKAKKETFYFRNARYSGLKMLIRGGKDELGAEGVEHTARFVPYYDTFKGDVVRVGYLATERKDVAERCRDDSGCEEIDEKEYTLAIEGDAKHKPLQRAPIAQA